MTSHLYLNPVSSSVHAVFVCSVLLYNQSRLQQTFVPERRATLTSACAVTIINEVHTSTSWLWKRHTRQSTDRDIFVSAANQRKTALLNDPIITIRSYYCKGMPTLFEYSDSWCSITFVMEMCQPRFKKTALFQQPIDTWLAH